VVRTVQEDQARVVLTRHGRPVAALVPVTALAALDLLGSPYIQIAGGHPYVGGDVVLVRRGSVGSYSLATVLNATGTAFDISSLMVGIPLHAILPGDEVLLVEAYWLGMVWRDFEPKNEQGWWAKEVAYSFRGSGASTYARTLAAVGS